ncbi:MAG: hypothetical protein ACYTXC_14450 [Nostoc sp.]
MSELFIGELSPITQVKCKLTGDRYIAILIDQVLQLTAQRQRSSVSWLVVRHPLVHWETSIQTAI